MHAYVQVCIHAHAHTHVPTRTCPNAHAHTHKHTRRFEGLFKGDYPVEGLLKGKQLACGSEDGDLEHALSDALSDPAPDPSQSVPARREGAEMGEGKEWQCEASRGATPNPTSSLPTLHARM